MQVLEQILQEIEDFKKQKFSAIHPISIDKIGAWCCDKIAEIVRSHMEDELVSNSDKLDGDKKEFIDIQDERLWDILSEEACVEGEQADRIKRRLREICASSMDDGWIPVEKSLPEDGEHVLVWYEYFRYGSYNRMFQTCGIGYQYDGYWSGDVSGTKARCIAWQPLPAPYQPKPKEQ